jgi:hypothetical protein
LSRDQAAAKIIERTGGVFAMNSMNDQRFFDLAMKAIAGQVTDAERAELDALFVRGPELKTEFARLQAEVRFMREVLPLVNATEATTGEFPAYARERLQTVVRQTLGRPEKAEQSKQLQPKKGLLWEQSPGSAARYSARRGAKKRSAIWSWLTRFFRNSSWPVIQVGILEKAGKISQQPMSPARAKSRREELFSQTSVRRDDTALLMKTWQDASVHSFTNAKDLKDWESESGKEATVKIIYDQPAGEIRVLGEWNGKTLNKTFLIDRDLSTTLKLVKNYVDHFIAA